jgi:TATA-box binding protein (TBP) (component of TFIID and TFIIIB)
MDQEFNSILEQAEGNTVYKHIHMSKPSICTATIVCCLSKKYISLDDVMTNEKLIVRHSKSKKKVYRPFSNSITLIFYGKKTIKVFCNGTLHITGCTSIQEAHGLVEQFCSAFAPEEKIQIEETRILTLNTTLKFKNMQDMIIDLEQARTTILAYWKDESKLMARYNPDIYQGLILKPFCENTNRKISILCFYTGSFILTGVKCPAELQFGLSFLKEAFHKVFESL